MSRNNYFLNISKAINKMVLDDWFLNKNFDNANQLAPLMLEVFYYYLNYGHCDFRWFGHHYPLILRVLKDIGFCTITRPHNHLYDIYFRTYPTNSCQQYMSRIFHKHIQHHRQPKVSVKDSVAIHPIICVLGIINVLICLTALVAMVLTPYKWTLGIFIIIINAVVIISGSMIANQFAYKLDTTLRHDVRVMMSGCIAEPRTFKDHHKYYQFLNNIRKNHTGINELLFLYSLSKDNDSVNNVALIKLLLNKVMFLNYQHMNQYYKPVIKLNGLQVVHNVLPLMNIRNAQILHKAGWY